jgi:hypothetical protein
LDADAVSHVHLYAHPYSTDCHAHASGHADAYRGAGHRHSRPAAYPHAGPPATDGHSHTGAADGYADASISIYCHTLHP